MKSSSEALQNASSSLLAADSSASGVIMADTCQGALGRSWDFLNVFQREQSTQQVPLQQPLLAGTPVSQGSTVGLSTKCRSGDAAPVWSG